MLVRSRSASDAGSSWRVCFLALCCAALPYALLVLRFDFVCDDAYIAFRYSRHLAQGHGLVFNLGEAPPVEGYSNLLWVLWLAPFERWGFDLGWIARATSITCGAGLIACTTRFAQRAFALGTAGTIFTALFFAVLPPVVMWSTGGLETMAFALCTFAVYERLCADPEHPHGIQAGVLAGIAALLRADGALWIGLVLACALVASSAQRRRATWRAGSITLAIVAVVTLLHIGWRESYYAELLPNTARVKAGLSGMRLERGLGYLASLALAVPVCVLVPLSALWAARWRIDRTTSQALLFLLGAALYALYTGGDFMAMGRFLVPAMPFVAVLFASTWASLSNRSRAGWIAPGFAIASIGLAALASSDGSFVPDALRDRVHFRWNEPHARSEVEMWRGMRDRAQEWSRLGRAIARFTQPTESITLGNIGAIGYFSDIHIYDVFGLTSRAVAGRSAPLVRASPGHDKAVGAEFFFDQRPTYLTAFIAPAGAPVEATLGPEWSTSPLAQRVDVVRHPLPAADGFAPGLELCLLRLRWKS
jgi:hypothetical protein